MDDGRFAAGLILLLEPLSQVVQCVLFAVQPCQISSMNKKTRSKSPLKPKAPFKWVFIDIIPATAPDFLTSETNFSNYFSIFDAYSKIPKNYGMDKITTEEVMDNLDVFQYRFVKIDEFGWWDLEIVSADAGTQFTSTEFKD